MSKEIIKNGAVEGAQKREIINETSFEDFVSNVENKRIKKIVVEGVIAIKDSGRIIQFSIRHTFQTINDEVLRNNEIFKRKPIGNDVSYSEDYLYSKLKLFVATEERLHQLQEKFSGINIFGPADRMDSRTYKEMSEKAKNLRVDEQQLQIIPARTATDLYGGIMCHKRQPQRRARP